MFRSYDRLLTERNKYFNLSAACQAELWKIGRATSAAPMFFSEQRIGNNTYVDGGLGCNNPVLVLVDEVEGVHGRRPELIVSIGTGTTRLSHSPGRYRLFKNIRNLVHTTREMREIVTNSGEAHHRLNTMRFPHYYRWNVPDLAGVELDEWLPLGKGDERNGEQTLQKMENATKNYLKNDIKAELETCAMMLVKLRRKRAETERWEQYATHTYYTCPHSSDCMSMHLPSREKLRLHVSERHSVVPEVPMDEGLICNFDICAEKPRMFTDRPRLADHLRDHHQFLENPEIMPSSEIEAWLDEGRHTVEAAFEEECP